MKFCIFKLIMVNRENKKIKVFVGMSGGVDSSVSATLLKEAGFDVVGVFIKVWQPEGFQCTWREDRLDAMRVCAHLGIPFKDLDLEKEYKKEVVDYMIREYKIGNTPNPDVMCNKYVKFGGFFDWAIKNGADFVATGHYTRVGTQEAQSTKSEARNKFRISSLGSVIPANAGIQNKELDSRIRGNDTVCELKISKDLNKDQSYFLWTLTQKQLSKTLFPVGGMTKPEVRKLAEKYGLPVADKKDSQGLCFIGKVEMKDFLGRYIKSKKGKVLNENGKTIGEHSGAFFYTIGQRHGFSVTQTDADRTRIANADNLVVSKDARPYYVVSKDIKKNTITVSENISVVSSATDETTKQNRLVNLKNVNWILGILPDVGKVYFARTRYREPLEKCKILKISRNSTVVEFEKIKNTVTSGQSLVIYNGDICLGGGVIV